MEQFELLRFVVGVLDRLSLRYFVTGSTATILYGEPRFTNDIDIVVDLPESQVSAFCESFPEADYYVSEFAARDAVRRKSQFNIIHKNYGLKIDVIVPEASAFNASRFTRIRRLQPEEKLEVWFASPEDAIIKKLQYYREGGSDKHLRDIASVLKTNSGSIDLEYISKWAHALRLEEIWAAVQGEAT